MGNVTHSYVDVKQNQCFWN